MGKSYFVDRSTTKVTVSDILNKIFFRDFVRGFSITFRYTFSKIVTQQYPDLEKWVPYERYRGRHTLNKNSRGKELCVACELCSKACPTSCITVIPEEDSSGKGIADRVAKVWKVDLVRCMFCGYCEDACPTTAVRLGREYELACTDFASTKMEKEQLLLPTSIPEDYPGGRVVKCKLKKRRGEITVVPDLEKVRKNFW